MVTNDNVLGCVVCLGVLLLFLSGCSSSNSAPTVGQQRQKIVDRIIKTYLPTDRTREIATIYATTAPVAPGIEISPSSHATDPTQTPPTYTLSKSSWVIVIDHNSIARFTHPMTYIFVPEDGSADEVHNEGWWPTVDGINLWYRNGHMEAGLENIVFEGIIASSWRANGRQP
jgi:hypothetical protein